MKPSFALNLTHDGISLLHRAQAGWLSVGDVSLDAPDLVDELVVLRRTASDLEAGGLTTKLVIPDSQILYVEVDAPGPSANERMEQIRAALVGLTPYDLHDLVFDWRSRGDKAQVAVVARDTLFEAEGFAMQYRFNPVSFVALPARGDFEGEPFFGPTRHAASLLTGGETIEPDERRIEILGRSDAAVEPAPKKPAARKGKKAEEVEAPAEDAAAAVAAPAEAEAAGGKPSPYGATGKSEAPAFSSRRKQAAPRVNGHALPSAVPAPPASAPLAPAAVVADLPPVESISGADLVARRTSAPKPDKAKPEAAPPVTDVPSPAARAAAVPPDAPELAGRADPVLDLAAPAAAAASAAAKPATSHTRLADALGRIARRPVTPPVSGDGLPTTPTPPRPAKIPPRRPATAAEADAMTVFGARGRSPQREKPRFLVPVLTVVLLLALGAVALWSSWFMNDLTRGWFGLGGEPEIAALEEPAPIIVPEALPSVNPDTAPIAGLTPDVAPNTVPQPDPVAEEDIPPSEPMPGVEVTALQPQADEAPPAAPAAPAAPDAGLRAPGGEGILPETTADAAPPELAPGQTPAGQDPALETAALAPPAAPAQGPALDDGPAPDVATIAPALTESLTPGDPAPAPGDGGAAPDELEIVRLQEPPAAEAAPSAAVEAPAPARINPPTPAEAEAFYARTGIAVLAPAPIQSPGGDRLDRVVLSSADPALADPRPRGLSDGSELVRPDVVMQGILPPLPLTTEFDLDERGFVRATAEGALTPQGAVVFRGTPPVVPGVRPGTPEPEPAATPEERDDSFLDGPAANRGGEDEAPSRTAEADEDPVPELVAGLDPEVLRDLAPILDESDLAEADERAELGGLTRDELARIRPSLRPGDTPDIVSEAAPEEVVETASLALEELPAVALPEVAEVIADAQPAPPAEAEAVAEAEVEVAAEVEVEAETVVLAQAEAEDGAEVVADTEAETPPGPDPLARFANVIPPLRPGTERPTIELAEAFEAAPETDAPEAAAEEAAPEPDPLARYAEVVPPLRPGTERPADVPAPAVEAAEEVAEVASLALADVPEDAPAETAGEEAAETPAEPPVALAAVVPPLRPGTPADAAADENEADAEAESEEPELDDATKLAVSESAVPRVRPSGFASVVETALEEAARSRPEPVSVPANDPTPAVAPPRAPDVPTTASVASAATEENALRLNRVNLIGVYGSSDNRRALVRLASGRYVKVQVGDTVDGGRVAAIGDDQLRYTKNGRTLTLSLPNS